MTSMLGTLFICAQIVGATGFQKYLLTNVSPLSEIMFCLDGSVYLGHTVIKHIFYLYFISDFYLIFGGHRMNNNQFKPMKKTLN